MTDTNPGKLFPEEAMADLVDALDLTDAADNLDQFDRAVSAYRSLNFPNALADRMHEERAQRRDAAEGAIVIPSFVTTLEVPDDAA